MIVMRKQRAVRYVVPHVNHGGKVEAQEYWDSCSSLIVVSFHMRFCIFGKLNQELIKMLQQECGLLQTIHNLPERQQYSFHFEAYGKV